MIKGFHSDNGSEYINKDVANLLNKLLIEQTKSRSRHSNDNALGESKNGSIVRKHYGYVHLPQHMAKQANIINKNYLNPYLNFHRPCLFATSKIDTKGKEKKVYRYKHIMMPYDKLKSLKNAKDFLKPNVTFEELDKQVLLITDTQSAKRLQEAKRLFFNNHIEQILSLKQPIISA